MIRIGSDTDIGMNRNSSDWLGMNSYPILSSGYNSKFQEFFQNRKKEIIFLTLFIWFKYNTGRNSKNNLFNFITFNEENFFFKLKKILMTRPWITTSTAD